MNDLMKIHGRLLGVLLWASLLCSLPAMALAAQEQPAVSSHKPVALVTTGRDGERDATQIIHRILLPHDIAFEVMDALPAGDKLADYSVVICPGVTQPLPAGQLAQLEHFVATGGTFIHTGAGLFLHAIEPKYAQNPWLGATRWIYYRTPVKVQCLLPGHPFFQGIEVNPDIAWFTGYYAIKPMGNTISLLGNKDISLLTVTPWKQGRSVWMWEGLFRIISVYKKQNQQEAVRLYANIILSGNPLTIKEQLLTKVPAFAKDPASLLVWQRDWQYAPQAGPRFLPAFADTSEYVHQVTFNSAINERDTALVLCQSLTPQAVHIEVAPLQFKENGKTYEQHLRLFVSDKAPVVTDLLPKKNPQMVERLGQYFLRPLEGTLDLVDIHPRVLWLELSTQSLQPGQYTSTLTLHPQQGPAQVIPIQVRIYPVVMPQKRLVDIRLWGNGMPNREPFLRELQRQGVGEMFIAYPDAHKILVRQTGQPLTEALKKNPDIFRQQPFPKLDFTGAYDQEVLAALDHGLFRARLVDSRTAQAVALVAGGKEHAKTPMNQWPDVMSAAFTGYMQELHNYFQDRGIDDVDMASGDEPSVEYIRQKYIPLARLVRAGHIGMGTTWTAGGFNTPQMVNQFAPYTTCWSMYTIMMPQFLGYLQQGLVRLDPRASVGITRGGWGLALRNAPNISRTYCWNIIHYGSPLSFIMTGPIWKEWIYYLDTDAGDARSKPEGVSGERLLAYGDADRTRDIPLWSSSDWEATRDGADDANLDRILTMTMDSLEAHATNDPALKQELARITQQRLAWFSKDLAAKDRIGLLPTTYQHADLHYEYPTLVPPSTGTLDQFKKQILEDLAGLAGRAQHLPATLLWNEWQLAQGEATPAATLMTGRSTSPEVAAALKQLQERCLEVSGIALRTLSSTDAEKDLASKGKPVTLLVGLADEPFIQKACETFGWQMDEKYLGPSQYVIKQNRDTGILLITATSPQALSRGITHFGVFLEGRNHWLLPPVSPAPILK